MDIIVRQKNSPETKNRFQKIEIIDNMIVGGNILQNSAASKYYSIIIGTTFKADHSDSRIFIAIE